MTNKNDRTEMCGRFLVHRQVVARFGRACKESADLAKKLIEETIKNQQVPADQLILHSDRGPSMASHSVAQLLANLGVSKSHSPRR